MNNCLPRDSITDAEGGKTEPATGTQTVRRLIVLMLLTAVVLDLTRCGLVMAAARHPAPTAGLVTAGLAAAALTARTARGCQAGRPWAGWVAVLIGLASAPQAAASGFGSPYLIPDTATAALGILLAVTILATAGRRPAGTRHRKSSWQRSDDQQRRPFGGDQLVPLTEHSPGTKRDSKWPGPARLGSRGSRRGRPNPSERNRKACARRERPLSWWPWLPLPPE